tara:strand:+ start:2080 stop:2400 length:321 start_codon:yes stop_codon:yes gene_type:complete
LQKDRGRDPAPLVLFLRYDCEICSETKKDLQKIQEYVDIRMYYVFDSRIDGKVEIRAIECEAIEGFPTLVDDDEIIEVPSLYDPQLDEMLVGVEEINEYLEECGLV